MTHTLVSTTTAGQGRGLADPAAGSYTVCRFAVGCCSRLYHLCAIRPNNTTRAIIWIQQTAGRWQLVSDLYSRQILSKDCALNRAAWDLQLCPCRLLPKYSTVCTSQIRIDATTFTVYGTVHNVSTSSRAMNKCSTICFGHGRSMWGSPDAYALYRWEMNK